MTALDKQALRDHMEQEIGTLTQTVEALAAGTEPVAPDDSIGRLSRLDTMQNQAIAGAALTNARSRLARIQAALRRLEDEDFGLCADCGEPIPAARLLAMPESTLCVRCAD